MQPIKIAFQLKPGQHRITLKQQMKIFLIFPFYCTFPLIINQFYLVKMNNYSSPTMHIQHILIQ